MTRTPPSARPAAWLSRAASAVLACLAAACTSTQPITIGLAGPFGDPVGAPMRHAARLAVAAVNEAGGIGGRPLALLEFDDHGDPDSAIAVAAALRASPAVAVVGHLWSTTTIAAAPVYAAGDVPLTIVSPSSSSPEVSWLGDHVFRVCPSDEGHGTALADWARQALGLARVGVLYLNDDYGRGVRRAFEARFLARGGEVPGSFPYLDPTLTGLFLDQLTTAGADGLLLAGVREDAAEVLAMARGRGLTLPVLGGDALEGIEAFGSAAEGVLVSAAWVPDGRTPEARAFLDAYAAAYPGEPLPNQPAAATWDAVHLLAAVLRAGGADRGAVREQLARVGTDRPAFAGITGTIGFTPEGDLAQGPIAVTVVRGGRAVRAEAP